MASITFNVFKKTEITTNKYLYSDLHLDFSNPVDTDVKADYDMNAIKNSIKTLFNTLPGQNLLNPEYGLNLLQYLFEPVSSTIARIIGAKIVKEIPVFEPRIRVQNVNIDINPDEQMYIITLSISVPSLNKNVQVVGSLNKEGFSLLV
jgi:phage baseplate assembly protein W